MCLRLDNVKLANQRRHAVEPIVGRERRKRVSQLTRRGEGRFNSRRRVNSDVRPSVVLKEGDMPYKLGKAFLYAVLLWVIGFVWGSIVFMTPALESIGAIPYVSSNPAISFPILIIWLIVTYLLAKHYLKAAGDKVAEGLKLGLVFSTVNVLLDLLVLVFLLKNRFSYFISLTVWLGYFMLFMIPWRVGRSS